MGKKLFSIIIILLLVFSAMLPAYAAPGPCRIHSPEELDEWYHAPAGENGWAELGGDIIISQTAALAQTDSKKEIYAIEHVIRVTSGGRLTLDNTGLILQGPGTVIVVEDGGTLVLKNGSVYTGVDTDAVIVKKGGQVICSPEFGIYGGGIRDENEEDDLVPPVSDVFPIVNIVGKAFSLSCMAGDSPDSLSCPETVRVVYQVSENRYEQTDLPVTWELDTVDFDTAGVYSVKGVFQSEILAANRLGNPYEITAVLKLLVQKPGAIDTMTGTVLQVGAYGNCLIRLNLPALPSEVLALYLYRSPDGQNWEKCVGRDAQAVFDDFLPYVHTESGSTYVNYRYQTDYQPIWLRAEVVGSFCQGMSNALRLEIPAAERPGEVTDPEENGDDGSSGGNRGGGGQEESSRELPEGSVAEKQARSDRAASGTGKETAKAASESSDTDSASGQTKSGKQETKSGTTDTGTETESAASAAKLQHKPIHKSRGVLLTAGITLLAAGALLLYGKMNHNRKH